MSAAYRVKTMDDHQCGGDTKSPVAAICKDCTTSEIGCIVFNNHCLLYLYLAFKPQSKRFTQ